LTDALGLLWGRDVTAANTSDQAGFRQVFTSVLSLLLGVVKVFADQGYQGLEEWLLSVSAGNCRMEIVKSDNLSLGESTCKPKRGFAIQAKRWIVERSISWLNWSRRLAKDYEQTTASSQAWIDVSAIRTALRKCTA
jgi:putative transposase